MSRGGETEASPRQGRIDAEARRVEAEARRQEVFQGRAEANPR